MEENFEEMKMKEGRALSNANRWLVATLVALIVVAGVALGYGYRQQILVGHLTAQQSMANATIGDMQGQVNALTSKLNEVTVRSKQLQRLNKRKLQRLIHPQAKAAATKRTTTENKRLKELQARIDDQQKRLKDTQDEVAKNRADLEGNLNSTRDDLNGSIAKTHEELVALAKRGERSYFEFDLKKSKEFQRIGTADDRAAEGGYETQELQRRNGCDDNKLSKKNVNLYEPIWIHTENDAQPVQVVVNRIGKDNVRGYVSAPKVQGFGIGSGHYGCSETSLPCDAPRATRANPEFPNNRNNKEERKTPSGRASTPAPAVFFAVPQVCQAIWSKLMKPDQERPLSEVLLDLRISRVRRQSARPGNFRTTAWEPVGSFSVAGVFAVELSSTNISRRLVRKKWETFEGSGAANKEAFEFAGESSFRWESGYPAQLRSLHD